MSNSNSLREALLKTRVQCFPQKPQLNVAQWADTYRYLSPESSSTPGKWKTHLVEPLRGPMEAISNPKVRKVSLMFASQLGKSEILLNTIGYYIHQNPSPILMAQPTQSLADSFAEDRVKLLVRDTSALKSLVKDPKMRDSGSTKTHLVFPSGTLDIVSAGSPSELASRPKKIILLDEIDRMATLSKEGNPLKLAEQRALTFFDSKVVLVSTPTNEGSSRIENSFLAGDQRHFSVPCPHCEFVQKLEWSQVKWDKDDVESAGYECIACKKKWTEVERMSAVKRGEYIAEQPFNGHASFHCNVLASPWITIPQLVSEFLECKDDVDELRTFVNLKLAETWKPKVDVPEWRRIYERRENYATGTIPTDKVKFLTCGVDVQGDRLEVQVIGWTKDKSSYVVDYQIIIGQTHTDEPWNKLYEIIQNRSYPRVDGTEMFISFACIDSGFNTTKVYDFVTRFSPNKVRAIKGTDHLRNIYKMGNDLEFRFDGGKKKFAHKLWIVGSSLLKEQLYSNLKLPSAGDNGVYPSGYIHTPELDEDYFRGLVSEGLQKTKKGYEWVKLYTRNEPLDTYNYARAAASMFGLDRFRDIDWEQLEGIQEPQKQSAEQAQQVNSQPQKPQQNSLWKNNLKPKF